MMNKKRIALTLLLVGLLSPAGSGFALQAGSNNHFLQVKFNLTVGQSRALPLSKTPKDCPIAISVAVTNIVENGVPSGPIVLVAWLVLDSTTGKTVGQGVGRRIDDCTINNPPPIGIICCGVSVDVAAYLVLDPNTGDLRVELAAYPGTYNTFSVCVNMSF